MCTCVAVGTWCSGSSRCGSAASLECAVNGRAARPCRGTTRQLPHRAIARLRLRCCVSWFTRVSRVSAPSAWDSALWPCCGRVSCVRTAHRAGSSQAGRRRGAAARAGAVKTRVGVDAGACGYSPGAARTSTTPPPLWPVRLRRPPRRTPRTCVTKNGNSSRNPHARRRTPTTARAGGRAVRVRRKAKAGGGPNVGVGSHCLGV